MQRSAAGCTKSGLQGNDTHEASRFTALRQKGNVRSQPPHGGKPIAKIKGGERIALGERNFLIDAQSLHAARAVGARKRQARL